MEAKELLLNNIYEWFDHFKDAGREIPVLDQEELSELEEKNFVGFLIYEEEILDGGGEEWAVLKEDANEEEIMRFVCGS